MSILFALSASGGVVTRFHLSPLPLAVGCGLLVLAASATRRLAQRAAERPMNAADTGDVGREAALIGLVLAMLAAIALIAAGLFEYS
jgi:hypothetical protein